MSTKPALTPHTVSLFPTADARIYRQGAGETLAVIRAGNGTTVNNNFDFYADSVALYGGTGVGTYDYLVRLFSTFNPGNVPGAVVTSASLFRYRTATAQFTGIGTPPAVHAVGLATPPASNVTFAASDYQRITDFTSFGSADFSPTSQYIEIPLNAAGKSYVQAAMLGSGFVTLAEILGWDQSGTFTGSYADFPAFSGFACNGTGHAGTSQDPYLVINYLA